MKRIGLITTNRVLAQSLSVALQNKPALNLEPYLLLDSEQVAVDAKVHAIDVAVIDVIEGIYVDAETLLSCCDKLKTEVPGCRILLLVPQEETASRAMAMEAIRRKAAEDFVFYDTSLNYLFAKISAI